MRRCTGRRQATVTLNDRMPKRWRPNGRRKWVVAGLCYWFSATDAVLRHRAGGAVFRVPPGIHCGDLLRTRPIAPTILIVPIASTGLRFCRTLCLAVASVFHTIKSHLHRVRLLNGILTYISASVIISSHDCISSGFKDGDILGVCLESVWPGPVIRNRKSKGNDCTDGERSITVSMACDVRYSGEKDGSIIGYNIECSLALAPIIIHDRY